MLANVKDVIAWIRQNDIKFWDVKTRDDSNSYIFKVGDDETFENAITRFTSVMELSQGGKFFIVGRQDVNAKKGYFREEFANLSGQNSIGSSQQPIQQIGMSAEDVQQKINEALAAERNRIKMEQLETEIKELRAENKNLLTPKEEFFRKAIPLVQPLLAGFVGRMFPAVAIQGIEETQEREQHSQPHEKTNEMEATENKTNEEMELSEADSERLFLSIQKWSAADPDFLNMIEKVADLAASKNPMYNMAKDMLIKL